LIGLLFVFIACDDDAIVLPLNDNINEVKAYDLDNNNNGSDIRVGFEVSSNLNVTEYRVMIVPSSSSNSFTEDVASTVPQESYFSVSPQTDVLEYSINRLPASLLDVTGNQISNGIDYEVMLFVIGTGNQRISTESVEIMIIDQGIYNGNYEAIEFQRSALISSVVNEFYSGIFNIPDPDHEGIFFFKLAAEDTLVDFEWISTLIIPEAMINCTQTLTGAGKVEDDLLLKFDVSGVGSLDGEEPCVIDTVSGTLQLIRQ